MKKEWITKKVLQKLIDRANNRISDIETGIKPPLSPDSNAKYFAEFEVDLDIISQPMIADPDVHNEDISQNAILMTLLDPCRTTME